MKYFSISFLAVFLLFCSHILQAQNTFLTPPPMSKADQEKLSKIPEFKMQETYRNRSLPSMVDNSTLSYFRPLIAQVGLECGQSSSIGIMFTYELNFKRNTSASLPENQIPTHFTYNFLNNGSDAGVNYYETFQIIRQAGSPSVADYGGMSDGGPSRWISGYDSYYRGMHNRINQIYSIKTNTEEGLNTLKQWIYDHADGSSAGGLACFYAEFSYPPTLLDAGTPEAGKHVIVQWGNSANHSMAIVGYNDSIRYDYNNDGQYTNHIDINGDGVVDMRDWEIGGFKMANTYGSISGWGDNGFAYMMYKTVADRFQQGGIWDNLVVIVDAKQNHEPKLTAKVRMSHDCRNKIKVGVGMSKDMQATEPDYVLNYPIFDFQGGCMPMQGNSGIEEIEFGLDLNMLLMHLEPSEMARFFLIVHENDPWNQNNGTVHEFSLVNYSTIPYEIESLQTEVPIVNNGQTLLTIDAPISFDKIIIDETGIPPLQLYQEYETQLNASGGTAPYNWSLVYDYETEIGTADFPQTEELKLTPNNNNDGSVAITLPFPFIFYGETYNEIYVSADGFIRFEEGLSTWPYYIDGRSYLKQNKLIAPCFSKPFYIANGTANGIFYSETEDYINIRWQLSVSGQSGSSNINTVARLYNNGEIKFFYGIHQAESYIRRYGGISAGDGENFIDLNPVGLYNPPNGRKTSFSLQNDLKGINLTKDGLLTALVEDYSEEVNILIQARDQDNIRSRVILSSQLAGVRMEFEAQAGGDSQIDFGEVFRLNLQLENLNDFDLSAGELVLHTSDPYFYVTDGSTASPAMNSHESTELLEKFAVSVSSNVPNGHEAEFSLQLTSAEGQWTRHIKLKAYNAELHLVSLLVEDGYNGILDPGDTAQLALYLHNSGGSALTNLLATISCNNPELTISNPTCSQDVLSANDEWEALFSVSLDENATPLEILEIEILVQADKSFTFETTVPLMTSLMAENFETGNFQMFEWELSGSGNWTITEDVVFEGNYAARSGLIGHELFSALNLSFDVAYEDSLSFYYKVSSEANYDFLRFKVNDESLLNVSGEKDWTKAGFLMSEGPKNFSWSYEKDYSVSNGSDCAWLDYIVFPARAVTTGNIGATASLLKMNISPNPVSHTINIQIESPYHEPMLLRVFNQQGQLVYSQKISAFNGSKNIKITDRLNKSGVYTLSLSTKNQSISKQLIKL
ncbi:MAG: T9SS type A sorting domain-containing protein [Bacteroidales bacterium]|nr:T9SS type A sorting domain-containing protein [Bacteroidales bacterium]